MNDRVKIYIGLAMFVIAATFPIWRAIGASPIPPDLEKPVRGTQCIESTEWMAANHQQLLNHWRDAVVREGRKTHTASDGTQYEMSLSKTCLDCHENQQTFCNRCHDFAGASLTCWDCHLDSSGKETTR